MASRSLDSVFQPIDRLTGRENYKSWSIAMKAYLQVEDLWDTIEGPRGILSTDPKKISKAKAKIILSVDPAVYIHVSDAANAHVAWNNLEIAYGDYGLEKRVSLVQQVAATKLEDCESVNEYINRIVTAGNQLRGMGMNIPDDWLGTFLLAGLPTEYKPMIMALGSSGREITLELVKIVLHQEVKVTGTESAHGSFTRSSDQQSRQKKERLLSKNLALRRVRCFNCNYYGHFSRECRAPRRTVNKACTTQAQDDSDDSDYAQLAHR